MWIRAYHSCFPLARITESPVESLPFLSGRGSRSEPPPFLAKDRLTPPLHETPCEQPQAPLDEWGVDWLTLGPEEHLDILPRGHPCGNFPQGRPGGASAWSGLHTQTRKLPARGHRTPSLPPCSLLRAGSYVGPGGWRWRGEHCSPPTFQMRKCRHKEDVLTVSDKDMVKVSCHPSFPFSLPPSQRVTHSGFSPAALSSHSTLVSLITP